MPRDFRPATDDDDTQYDLDDPQDDDLLDDDAGDEGDDDLSDLEDEARERVERQMARLEAKHTAALRARDDAAESVGLAFDGGGKIAVRDLGRASSYFSPLARRQETEPQPAPRPQAPTPEPENEEWVSPDLDPTTFKRQMTRHIDQATEPYKQAINQLHATIVEDKIDRALGDVEKAIDRYAPAMKEYLEHPEFEDRMRAALGSMGLEQWRSQKDLARVVGLIGPDLEESTLPRTPKPQDRQQPSAQERARTNVQRSTLHQTAPSRSTSPGRGKEYSDEDRMVAERLGIPLDEAAALGEDTYGDSYREARAKAKKANR